MRLLLLTPALALSLAACGKSDDSETQNAGRELTAEAISSNDVTAIDAVTGEAANIAEDVDFTVEMNNSAEGEGAGNRSASRRRPQATTPAPGAASNSAAPAPEPAAPAEPQNNAQ